MSWHPTDEDLVLHFYGEGKSDEARIDAHLNTCSGCRETWAELGETMKLVDAASVPEPPDGFERVMWARVAQALPASVKPRSTLWSVRGLLPLAGLAALVILAIAVGRFWPSESKPAAPAAPVTASATDARQARERVLLTALDEHFGQTEMVLVELMNTSETGRTDLGFERDAAGDLVASGRLYRVTAEENGDGRLAQMLEDLEWVLVEVARGPEALNRKDLDSLRARIDSQDLLFKVRAVTNQIHERQRNLSTSSEGPL